MAIFLHVRSSRDEKLEEPSILTPRDFWYLFFLLILKGQDYAPCHVDTLRRRQQNMRYNIWNPFSCNTKRTLHFERPLFVRNGRSLPMRVRKENEKSWDEMVNQHLPEIVTFHLQSHVRNQAMKGKKTVEPSGRASKNLSLPCTPPIKFNLKYTFYPTQLESFQTSTECWKSTETVKKSTRDHYEERVLRSSICVSWWPEVLL